MWVASLRYDAYFLIALFAVFLAAGRCLLGFCCFWIAVVSTILFLLLNVAFFSLEIFRGDVDISTRFFGFAVSCPGSLLFNTRGLKGCFDGTMRGEGTDAGSTGSGRSGRVSSAIQNAVSICISGVCQAFCHSSLMRSPTDAGGSPIRVLTR